MKHESYHNKNANIKKVNFILPIIIFMIWLILYFSIIPQIYGRIIHLEKYLVIPGLTDKKYRMLLFESVLNGSVEEVGLRFLVILWETCFIISLFFSCKGLHEKRKAIKKDARLVESQPYFFIQDVRHKFEQNKLMYYGEEYKNILYLIKCLEEKLYVEHDFGCGNQLVIQCENEIAEKMFYLEDIACKSCDGRFSDNLNDIIKTVKEIDILLRKRQELIKIR